jgi:apolipoprotein N-acyltransferase
VTEVSAPVGQTEPVADEPAGPPPVAPPPLVSLPLAVALSLAGGVFLLLAFPPYDLFPLAPLSVAVLALITHRRRPRTAAGLGALYGLVFFVPILSWTNLHTGNLPWLLLSGLEAAFLALLAAAAAYVSPLADRRRWSWPLLTGLLWVLQEALRDHTPFGGFPWARLAFSQGDSPLLGLAALGGAPLVTFAVALTGGLLAAAAAAFLPTRARGPGSPTGQPSWRAGGAYLGGALLVTLSGFAVPAPAPAADGAGGERAVVAIVQGNVPRLGLDFNAQRRAVLDNHARATVALAERVATGDEPRPDLVVWPENSSDIDPLRNGDAADVITRAARAIDAPILVGAVLRGPGEGEVRNAGLLWRPDTGPDEDQTYVKRHPVPFAEYVPLRRIARMVSSEVDRVRADFVAGTEPGVLDVGPVVVGDVICFEVAYDEIVRDTVIGGAQILAVQTNNATFNEAEARQQLAMVRLRAVEHGREALMASTVGVSAFVRTDGTVVDASGFNVPAVAVREMRLGTTRTLATSLGYWPELGLVALAVAALRGAALVRRGPASGVRRRAASAGAATGDGDGRKGGSQR